MELAHAPTVPRAPARVRRPEPAGDLTVESPPALVVPRARRTMFGYALGLLRSIGT